MKKRQKRQIVVNKIIEQPKPKKEPIDWNVYLKKMSNGWVSTQNFFIFLFNKLFKLRMLVLMGSISAASIEFFLVSSNITQTYHELSAFAGYMAAGLLFSLIITEIVILHPFKYHPTKAPLISRSRNIEVRAESERNYLKWEVKEKARKLSHRVKWTIIKSMMTLMFIILLLVNLNFSFGELSSAVGKDINVENKIAYEVSTMKKQVEDYDDQIEQMKKSIENLDPVTWKTKRENISILISETSKLRNDKLEEIKKINGTKRTESLLTKPIKNTYDQVRTFFDVTLEEYIAIVNALLSLGFMVMYVSLTYAYTAMKGNEDTQVIKLKKVIKRRK